MFNKKIILSILFIAFIGIGAAGTWATVNSATVAKDTGAITVAAPTVTLTAPVGGALYTNNVPVSIGYLVFTPDEQNTIGDVQISSITGYGGADNIVLYATYGDADHIIYEGANVAADTLLSYTPIAIPGWLGISGSGQGTAVTIPIKAAFINTHSDQTATTASFTISGLMKTATA
jgi:uncharacterized protein (UPF0333 family)